MTSDGWITLIVLAVAAVLFITRWLPLAVTALAIPVVLFATGVIADVRDAMSGFGNLAVLTIGAVMVVGAGLRESGVAGLMARLVMRIGGKTEVGVITVVMTGTATLAVFMNNTAVVALLLPAALALSRSSGIAPSRIMMPLAFAAVLGGTVSVVGTAPNMLVANFYEYELEAEGQHMGVFDFAPAGIPITIMGILAMALIARRLLPLRHPNDGEARQRAEDAANVFGVGDQLFEMKVVAASRVLGKTIAAVDIRRKYDLSLVVVRRKSGFTTRWLIPEPGLALREGDILYAEGSDLAAWAFAEAELVQFGLAGKGALGEIVAGRTAVAEAIVAPHSRALGRTVRQLDFRRRYGLNVISLWRDGKAVHDETADTPLTLGTPFLVSGSRRAVSALHSNPDFLMLTDMSSQENFTRAPIAIGCLLVALLPAIFLGTPLVVSATGAALLIVMTRCLARPQVIRAIDWSVLALIAGTIPLGIALKQTGIAGTVADWMNDLAGGHGPAPVFALLFGSAALLSVLSSNAAAAVIMLPVAVRVAELTGVPAREAMLAMAYGCSCNFLLPFAQCNVLVMHAGRYTTVDYMKAGAVMSLTVAATAITVLTLLL